MELNEEKIKEEWAKIDSCKTGDTSMAVCEYLADYIASLCGFTRAEMFSRVRNQATTHARWLFWYAYRFMTKDTYSEIAYRTESWHFYTSKSVQVATQKMSSMIDSEPMWNRRWRVVKQFIKLREGYDDEKLDNTIIVQVPRHIKDKIQIVIKEK